MRRRLFVIITLSAALILGFAAFETMALADQNSGSEKGVLIQQEVGDGSSGVTQQAMAGQTGTVYSVSGMICQKPKTAIFDAEGNRCKIIGNEVARKIYGINCGNSENGIGITSKMKKISRGSLSARGIVDEVDEAELLGEEIVTYSQGYLGKGYSYGATGPDYYDCSGFLYTIFGAFDVDVPRSSSSYGNMGTAVSLSDARAGDVICFARSGSGISHVAIYMGDGQFIHSATSAGVIISSTSDEYWGPKICTIRRILE